MSKEKVLSATEAREHFRQIIDRAEYLKQSTPISKFGRIVARVIPEHDPSVRLVEKSESQKSEE